MEEKIKSGTEALGGPAGGLGESKDEGIVFVKPSPNTNEVCKENSKTKNIFYLYLTCVVKISRRKFNDIKLFLFYSFWLYFFSRLKKVANQFQVILRVWAKAKMKELHPWSQVQIAVVSAKKIPKT